MEESKDKDIVEIETQELSPLSIIKTEANLAGLPFFALSRQDVRRKIQTEYRTIVKRDGKRLEVSWNVTANAKYGYPGPFDRKVHKAIEYIVNEQGIPIENPVPFSIYQIMKILGSNPSGRTRQRIRQSLLRIFSASVASEGTFYSKTKKQYISDNFHIYDRVIFKEQTLPDGEIADTNYVFLSQWYLDSINAFYVRPLDFEYFRRLRSDIAGRLYELLGLKFHGVILNQRSYWKVEYKELCDLLPITAQKYLSDAKRHLASAHRELTKTQFLSKVVWTKDKEHWQLFYYPGKKAREEVKPKSVQERLRLELPERAPTPSGVSKDLQARDRASTGQMEGDAAVSGWTSKQEKRFSALRERGVSQKQARHLVEEHGDWIERGIELWELERKRNPKGIKNPAGYLVAIIEAGEDWQPPEEYVSPEKRKRREEKEARQRRKREAKETEERRRQGERIARIERVLEGLSEREKEEIREEVVRRIEPFLRNQRNFYEISRQDIASWESSGMLESRFFTLRNEVVEERFLSGEERK